MTARYWPSSLYARFKRDVYVRTHTHVRIIFFINLTLLCSRLVYWAKNPWTELSVQDFLVTWTQKMNAGSVQGNKIINCGYWTVNTAKKFFVIFSVRSSQFKETNHSLRYDVCNCNIYSIRDSSTYTTYKDLHTGMHVHTYVLHEAGRKHRSWGLRSCGLRPLPVPCSPPSSANPP